MTTESHSGKVRTPLDWPTPGQAPQSEADAGATQVVSITPAAQEEVVRKPNRLLVRRASRDRKLEFREARARAGSGIGQGIASEERVFVQREVEAACAGNALGVERL